ncbi:MAG: hypothetical protein PHC95_15245 [Parabacteroides sp.]|nr:hypothetical protein [Parabacteroides sp.]
MTTIEVYNQWRSSLNAPDDSIFYYHPSLDRIILGCAMYQIASRPLMSKLGKAESLTVINIYINDTITAWIDEDGEAFDSTFGGLMTLMQAFFISSQAMIKRYPAKKKIINLLQSTFAYWVPIAGDINEERADELLDSVETDGQRIFSDKISKLVERIQPIVAREGIDMDMMLGLSLIENPK